MNQEVLSLWPELEWISNNELREQTAKTWELALERSVLTPDDLNRIPFTLLCGPDLKIAGAILADVAKLLEYVLDENGTAIQGTYGKYLRHPFSGVSIAEECEVPAEVCHIIATHAGEGNMVKRTTEAYVVHHADFMTFLPFKERLIV